ncbi:MAG: hypothetical protein IPJ34_40870 [Myxococcales bacterium]|nr:hypothetical protein [Myxococcales bacterium]
MIAHRLSLGGARPVIRELCEALVAYLLCKAPPRQAVGALREAVSALGLVLPAPMAIDAQSDQVAMVAKQLGIDPQEPLEVGDLVHLGLSWTELHLALDLILTLRDQLPHWVFDGEIATATGALGAACRLAKDPIATAKLSEVRDELPKLSAQVKDLSALPRPRDMAALPPHERLRLAIQSLQTASRQHQQIEALPSWIPEPVRGGASACNRYR